MDVLSRYWKIYRISTSQRVGYEHRSVPAAQEFIQQIRHLALTNIQAVLLSYFLGKNPAVDAISRAKAGLCLRCYVSEPILRACQKIDNLFSGDKYFTYQDLLTYVLNDDGETLVIVDEDGKTQLKVDKNGETRTTSYNFFSLKILQTFNADLKSKMSLDNWAFLKTTQNPELKGYLAEFGFQHFSDWALINRVRVKQFESLSKRARHLVEVFHAVYGRDTKKNSSRVIKYPEPSSAQLQEMLKDLQKRDIIINSTFELMNELKQVVTQLRHYDIWSSRESLEVHDYNTGGYTYRTDLPTNNFNEVDIEEQEILDFLREQLSLTLSNAIKQEIGARINNLKKSKYYSIWTEQFLPGLQLYYSQSLSLKDIAPKLGMTSWDQARRVLNPGELLSKIRTRTVQQVLDSVLSKAEKKGLTKIPAEPEYLKKLAQEIEAFADDEIFREAAEEIRVGKDRSMNSFYAQSVRSYLIKSQERVVNEASQLEESGANANQLDLPTSSSDKLDGEQRKLLDVLHEQLRIALAEAIEQELRNHITTLQRSKKYSSLTKQYIPGLQLYYCEAMPLREIAPKLGMTSWNQARRVLNPGELLEKVRTLTLQQLIDSILKKAEEKGLTQIPPEPDYLKSLAEQIEAFADKEVFQEAAEEIRAGKNRSMDSVYAQLLRSYLQEKDCVATNDDGGVSKVSSALSGCKWEDENP